MQIALIAHDKKKSDMIRLSKKYKEVLAKHEIFATGTTGTMVMGETGIRINRMKSGPLGGDQQIGSMIANSQLDLVIFLRDPLTAQPHEPDVSALLRLCDVTNIPLATNISSAEIMLKALERDEIPCRKGFDSEDWKLFGIILFFRSLFSIMTRRCGLGGTGRRVRLRGVWLISCEFKSHRPHHVESNGLIQ